MGSIRSFTAAFVYAVCILGIAIPDDSYGSEDNPIRLSENVCGPRCAQYVLKSFGREEELISIIKELQWPDFANGSSLDDINHFFKSRGFFTNVIHMRKLSDYRYDFPAIAHVENDSTSSGHFVVITRHGNQAAIWDGLQGYTESYQAHSSSAVLIISNSPLSTSKEIQSYSIGVFAVGALFAFLAFCASRAKGARDKVPLF